MLFRSRSVHPAGARGGGLLKRLTAGRWGAKWGRTAAVPLPAIVVDPAGFKDSRSDNAPPEEAVSEEAVSEEAGSGPVLALLSRGLEFWVRQQCQAIDTLEIRLEGSAWQLLRGRLDGVRVQARGVRYQDLELAEVRLRSEAMRVRMGTLLRRQVLELEHPFQVVGAIVFSSEGLNRSLAHPNWNWLGDDLAEGLLGIRQIGRAHV